MITRGRKIYDKTALVRLTEKELLELHDRAEEADLSLSRYLVRSGLSEGEVLTAEEKEELRQLRFEIRKIGTNLNQIAFTLNAAFKGNGEAPSAAEIRETTKKIDEVLEITLQIVKNL